MPALERERNQEFNLQEQINTWVTSLQTVPSLTEADSEELKYHFLDLLDELKALGLDDEEAFWVATKRMGNSFEWEAAYREVNNPIIQMRTSLIILAGVLAYFLLYYFLQFSSKLLLIAILASGAEGYVAIQWIFRYLAGSHILFILFTLSIYFFENRTIQLIERVKLRPKHAVYLLSTAIVLGILDTCLRPISKSMMRKVGFIESRFYDINFYFDYSFPLLICSCFVFLFFKYFRKSKF